MTFLRKGMVVLVLLVAAGTARAQDLPGRPQGYVTDSARVLSAAAQQRLEALCGELERKTGAQLAVVTVPSVGPEAIEQYAVALFQRWGIGRKGKDDGVLFLAAINDRQMRIEVGYGLEDIITDAGARTIIERFVLPSFRRQAYAEGIEFGTAAIVGLVAQARGVTIAGAALDSAASADRHPQSGNPLLSLIVLIVMGIVFITNPRLFMLLMLSGMGGGRRGVGYGGGGFGGGFGGFGGGMSGGGGASGRW